MVHFTGAGENLVGVTHECDYPPGVEMLPKLTSSKIDHSMTSAEIDAAIGAHLTDTGSIYALDARLLEELSPDLILTQGLCDVCAVSMNLVKEAASGLHSRPEILSLNPTSLREVLDDAARVGEVLGRKEETRRRSPPWRRGSSELGRPSRVSPVLVSGASSGSTRPSPPDTGSPRWCV